MKLAQNISFLSIKNTLALAVFISIFIAQATAQTVCNPVNISYRFRPETPSRREAADPTMITFKGVYYLFASKSGGYWYSNNMASWTFIATNDLPSEDYAPTAVVIGDTVFFVASSGTRCEIYKTTNPKLGKWERINSKLNYAVTDPALFLDDDGRLYFYWGCSDHLPIFGVELDMKNQFAPIGKPDSLLFPNTAQNGWENPGDYNTLTKQKPWIEGAWMNKIGNKYYLQYSGPGTEYKSYADGVYVGNSPLGPFKQADSNPFAYKPEGFACGAGHGSTFADKYGNYWHIGTVTISQKHYFERRLSIFPAFVDKNKDLISITKFGDYPYIIPTKKINSANDIFPGWMLLSYNKKVEVSSVNENMVANNMTDENIRTYWAAKSGTAKEWAKVDLGKVSRVSAFQLNFAEHTTNLFGRNNNLFHKYIVEYSSDNKNWKLLIDKSKNTTDNTHNYFQLDKQIDCRYLRVKNLNVPDGCFAISDFRIFGKGYGAKPSKITKFEVERNKEDARSVNLKWSKSLGATGYNISFGIAPDKLYQNYMVYGDTSLTINSLNANKPYYFKIEAFNENGITINTFLNSIK